MVLIHGVSVQSEQYYQQHLNNIRNSQAQSLNTQSNFLQPQNQGENTDHFFGDYKEHSSLIINDEPILPVVKTVDGEINSQTNFDYTTTSQHDFIYQLPTMTNTTPTATANQESFPPFETMQDNIETQVDKVVEFKEGVEQEFRNGIFIDNDSSAFAEQVDGYAETISNTSLDIFRMAMDFDEDQLYLKSSLTELGQNVLRFGQVGFYYAKEICIGAGEGGIDFSSQWEDTIDNPLIKVGDFFKGIGSTFKLISRAAYEAYATEYYSDVSVALRARGEYELADEMRLPIQNELQQTNLILEGLLDKIASGSTRDNARRLTKIALFRFTLEGLALESLSKLNKVLKGSKVLRESKVLEEASSVAQKTARIATKKYAPRKVPTTTTATSAKVPLLNGTKAGTITTNTNPVPKVGGKKKYIEKFGTASEQAGGVAKKFAGKKASKLNKANLRGKKFEEHLVKKLGGRGSFRYLDREFDGAFGSVWYEAKSGKYWDLIKSNQGLLDKFQSDMGRGLKYAIQNGKKYELHSNVKVPKDIKSWLFKKGINVFEW